MILSQSRSFAGKEVPKQELGNQKRGEPAVAPTRNFMIGGVPKLM
jgi:hypothetical protein